MQGVFSMFPVTIVVWPAGWTQLSTEAPSCSSRPQDFIVCTRIFSEWTLEGASEVKIYQRDLGQSTKSCCDAEVKGSVEGLQGTTTPPPPPGCRYR